MSTVVLLLGRISFFAGSAKRVSIRWCPQFRGACWGHPFSDSESGGVKGGGTGAKQKRGWQEGLRGGQDTSGLTTSRNHMYDACRLATVYKF